MDKAFMPMKRVMWNILGKRAAFPRTFQPASGQTACRTLYTSSSAQHGGQLHRPTHCRMSSARLMTSGPVVSPGDIRSPLPDVDIPVVNFAEFILNRCDLFKDRIAVSDRMTGKKYTYLELKASVIRVASALHRQGYRKGDVITPFTTNLPEFPVLALAAMCLGVIVSPANPAYKALELSHILTNNGAVAVFTIPQLLPVVQEAIGNPDLRHNVKAVYTFGHAEAGAQFFQELMEEDGKAFPENVDLDPVRDVLALPYSSGTTGLPKGVMLSHHNLVASILQCRALVPVTPDDASLGMLPFFHMYGFLIVLFGSLYDGAHMVTVPRFEPEMFLKAIQDEKISVLHAVPPVAQFLASHPLVSNFDLSSLQYVICGAAPMRVPLTLQCQDRLGIPVYQGYGLTEATTAVTIDSSPGHPGTVGHLVTNTQAKLISTETGEEVGVGEVGELLMKGPQMMLGYYNNQQATDAMIDAEGWLHTGDLGSVREDGCFVIEDRMKELIKYKGFQVPPAELESLLLTHPDVQDAAVIGVPDEGAGELPRAYVVLKPDRDVSATDICDFVEKNASPHKKLRGGVEFVDVIPKTPSGKILRRELRAKSQQTK